MIVKLEKEVFDYLMNILLNNQFDNLLRRNIVSQEGMFYYIDLSKKNMDDIRELALNRIQVKGFNEMYELTREGEILENIIDLFYI